MKVALVPITTSLTKQAQDLDALFGAQPAWNNSNFVAERRTTKTTVRAIVSEDQPDKAWGYIIWSCEVTRKESMITRLVVHPLLLEDHDGEAMKQILDAVKAKATKGYPVTGRVPLMHVEVCKALSATGMKPSLDKDDREFVHFKAPEAAPPKPTGQPRGSLTVKLTNRLTRVE